MFFEIKPASLWLWRCRDSHQQQLLYKTQVLYSIVEEDLADFDVMNTKYSTCNAFALPVHFSCGP